MPPARPLAQDGGAGAILRREARLTLAMVGSFPSATVASAKPGATVSDVDPLYIGVGRDCRKFFENNGLNRLASIVLDRLRSLSTEKTMSYVKSMLRVVLASIVLALGAAPMASAGPILPDGTWVGFCFEDGGGATSGCQNLAAQTSGNSFTFTVGDGMVLQVTDAFNQGDMFAVYDFGVLLFTTSLVPNTGADLGDADPDAAWANAGYSHGQILLAAGAHRIDIFNVQGCCGGGGAYMRVAVPEPGSLALIAVAMIGVAATRRRKQR